MQNISCPLCHGNASGLAQQELEDEDEENDMPLFLALLQMRHNVGGKWTDIG